MSRMRPRLLGPRHLICSDTRHAQDHLDCCCRNPRATTSRSDALTQSLPARCEIVRRRHPGRVLRRPGRVDMGNGAVAWSSDAQAASGGGKEFKGGPAIRHAVVAGGKHRGWQRMECASKRSSGALAPRLSSPYWLRTADGRASTPELSQTVAFLRGVCQAVISKQVT